MSEKPLQRILYVEDEPDIQAVARVSLEKIGGFTLQIADGGQDAVAVAPGFQPDLILLDVMMPGMDGPQTLQALKALPAMAETPVMFMTAKVQPGEVQHLRSLGAVDVIAKPFNPMTLPQTIRDAWQSALSKSRTADGGRVS